MGERKGRRNGYGQKGERRVNMMMTIGHGLGFEGFFFLVFGDPMMKIGRDK